jgi:hypothetical protein
MAWIESHQSLGRHPKTKRLARQLGIGKPQAIGHLHYLWWWALDYAQNGDLSGYSDEDIAEAAEWEGDPHEFVTALRECGINAGAGFLDAEEATLHDWMDYAGKLIERRKSDAARKRNERKADGTSDERTPDVAATSDVRPQDVLGTSDGHPGDVLRTVPNRTQPNSTNTYVAPKTAPVAPNKSEKTITPRFAVFSALTDVCGYDKDRLTKPERAELNAATKSLVDAKYGPLDVQRMAGNWETVMGTDCTMTPSALAKHATRLLKPPNRRAANTGVAFDDWKAANGW